MRVVFLILLPLVVGCVSPTELRWSHMHRDFYNLCMEREGWQHDPLKPNQVCTQEAKEKLEAYLRCKYRPWVKCE